MGQEQIINIDPATGCSYEESVVPTENKVPVKNKAPHFTQIFKNRWNRYSGKRIAGFLLILTGIVIGILMIFTHFPVISSSRIISFVDGCYVTGATLLLGGMAEGLRFGSRRAK